MMRARIVFLAMVGFALFGVKLGNAALATFDETQTYSSTVRHMGGSEIVPYVTLDDGMRMGGMGGMGNSNGYSSVFSQSITFSSPVSSFNNAHLSITYSDISTNTNSELWYALVSSSAMIQTSSFTSLGQLPGYGDAQRTVELSLKDMLPQIPDGGLSNWTLYIAFGENTMGMDSFKMYNTRIYGDYNDCAPPHSNVPEPGAMFLLGSGFAGLMACRRLGKA